MLSITNALCVIYLLAIVPKTWNQMGIVCDLKYASVHFMGRTLSDDYDGVDSVAIWNCQSKYDQTILPFTNTYAMFIDATIFSKGRDNHQHFYLKYVYVNGEAYGRFYIETSNWSCFSGALTMNRNHWKRYAYWALILLTIMSFLPPTIATCQANPLEWVYLLPLQLHCQ